MAQEMHRLGWAEADLHAQRKGDKRKVTIARRLRQETTMSLKWIAQRLQMGSLDVRFEPSTRRTRAGAPKPTTTPAVSIVRTDTCPVSQPQLTITPAEGDMILSWPTNFTGFTLQSTLNFISPVWTAVLPAPVIVNGLNTVTNLISGTQQFFRLSE